MIALAQATPVIAVGTTNSHELNFPSSRSRPIVLTNCGTSFAKRIRSSRKGRGLSCPANDNYGKAYAT
jgi:hypothetical protein